MAGLVGCLVQAARQIQLLRIQEIEYPGQCVERTQHPYPAIADDVISIYTYGYMPKYTPLPQKTVPEDGHPRNAANTVKVMDSMWGDVEEMKAVLRETASSVYGKRLGYIPTTKVHKRLPGRTFSDMSRTISDLRRSNMVINTDDFPPIRLPGIKHIPDRIFRRKRQFAGAPIKICKGI